MHKKWTTEEFIIKANEIHNNRYDYSLVDYKTSKIKVKFICSKHGEFTQTPSNHIKSIIPCKKCASENMALNLDNFIKNSEKFHNNKYDYSLVNYKTNSVKVKIVCPEHGVFEQLPVVHMQGFGCSKCSNKYIPTTKEFIIKANKIHNNRYDYSLAKYTHSEKNIRIICREHGEFNQRPHNHLQGQGCPRCKESKGEKIIAECLIEKDINFELQYTFNKCRNINPLPFDFYLPEYNICIEYDGIQHFEHREFFGDINSFIELKKRDRIKNKYCENNNINLIRISYKDNIGNKLEELYGILDY